MLYGNHLRYAAGIVKDYDGGIPLSAWLKDFFKANKQMGSRDRKTVSDLVYGYYRLGHLHYENVEERLLDGLNKTPKPGNIFPWAGALSKAIDADEFSRSFLVQPDLYIRIRPGKENTVLQKLDDAAIHHYPCGNGCIGLPNTTKIDSILDIDAEAVIQDKNSQQTGSFVPVASDLKVWDCCAASGGKSIMVHDLIKNIDLTVSDIRPSIIHNLKERFSRAGITTYRSFVADLSRAENNLPGETYDLIIADVPCSGSGTWARTPEQLYFFKEEKIDQYSALQQKILTTIAPSLKPGGYLLYITCSVFAKENEAVVEYTGNGLHLDLIRAEILKGYQEKADTLFAALFKLNGQRT